MKNVINTSDRARRWLAALLAFLSIVLGIWWAFQSFAIAAQDKDLATDSAAIAQIDRELESIVGALTPDETIGFLELRTNFAGTDDRHFAQVRYRVAPRRLHDVTSSARAADVDPALIESYAQLLVVFDNGAVLAAWCDRFGYDVIQSSAGRYAIAERREP